MKLKYIFIALVASLFLLSCENEAGLLPVNNDEEANTETEVDINLSMTPFDDVVLTKSNLESFESVIQKLFIVVFDKHGYYRCGEKVDISRINDLYTDSPYYRTKMKFADEDIVYAYINPETEDMGSFVAGATTKQDVMMYFTGPWQALSQQNLYYMPMFGKGTYLSPSTSIYVSMSLCLAKVTVEFDNPKLSLPMINSTVLNYESSSFKLCNYSLDQSWTPDGGRFDPSNISDQIGIKSDSYQSPAVYACASMYSYSGASDIGTFHKSRPCVVLCINNEMYYRLDLYDRDRQEYYDIEAGIYYRFVIKSINSIGYPSFNEAFNNPASNIDYDVYVDGDDDNCSTTNGQYVLTVEQDEINFTADWSMKFSLTTTQSLNIQTAKIQVYRKETDGSYVVATMPMGMTLDDSAAYVNTYWNALFFDGYISGDLRSREFELTLSDGCLADYQALSGKYLGITIGNVVRMIPIK